MHAEEDEKACKWKLETKDFYGLQQQPQQHSHQQKMRKRKTKEEDDCFVNSGREGLCLPMSLFFFFVR